LKQKIISNIDSSWPHIEVDFYKSIDLYVDSFANYKNNENYKILWVKEVDEISNFSQHAINNAKHFDLILAYNQDVLDQCQNSIMFEFGTSWILGYENKNKKKFQISHLTGGKNYTQGHKLRQSVYKRQREIINPIDFYISSHIPIINDFNSKFIHDKKDPLFDSQFHICIENSKQKNLFTEKLIDCLYSKTVPIFWGCENINNFFDTRGFLTVNSVEEIIKVCNSLEKQTYQNKIEYINYNYEKSLQYLYLTKRLQEKLQEILSKNIKT
jgi:hypothetical protein